ncbi:MAG: GNAT family N-acetyltransferase [Verrucomicrobia bacterium]|nr:GNAT family N-acetyltransferase [Verrucomicrobiota bacterium]
MTGSVSLRPVEAADLPIFFAHQADPESCRMAAFPSRDHAAFMAHWQNNILGHPTNASRTILADAQVIGNICAWTAGGTRYLGYWIGREHWGRGLASAALAAFLQSEKARPLTAQVVKHNLGSIRVLEKNGFARTHAEAFTLPDGTRLEELTYTLLA